jgi:hypothetical protein
VIDCGQDWRDYEVDDNNPATASRSHVETVDELGILGTNVSSVNFNSKTQSALSKTIARCFIFTRSLCR